MDVIQSSNTPMYREMTVMTHSACVVAVVRGSSEASRASEYDPTGTSAGTHGHDIVQSQSTVTSASGVVDIPWE